MARPPSRVGIAGALLAVGVLCLLYSYLRTMVTDGAGAFRGLPAVIGAVALVSALITQLFTKPEGLARFVREYWLLLAFLGATAIVVLLPIASLSRAPLIGGMPEWVARVALLILLEGAAVLAYVLLVRWGGLKASDRTAAMANGAFLIQVAIGLLVAVNVIGAGRLKREVGIADLTEMQAFSLSDETRGVLDDLVNVPGRLQATFFQFGSSGPLGELAIDFLSRYADYTGGFSVESVHALRDPMEAKARFAELGLVEYEVTNVDTIVFTFHSPDSRVPRRRDIEISRGAFFTPGLGTDKFLGEQLFTSAIRDVVYPRKKVYFLTGHRELSIRERGPTGYSAAADLLDRLALEAAELSLAGRGSVPEDAGLIVVAGPQNALEPTHRRILTRYLDAGGAMVLLMDPQSNLVFEAGETLEFGLEEYLAELGIRARTEFISMDHEIVRRAGGIQQLPEPTPVLLTESYAAGHAPVEELLERRLGCRFVEACPIEVSAVERKRGQRVVSHPLVHVRLTLPEVPGLASYAARLFPGRDPGRPDAEKDIMNRRLHVVAVAERLRHSGVDERGRPVEVRTRVAVVGDTDFASNRGLVSTSNYYAPGNAPLFSNLVSWAAEREGLMAIDPKIWERERVALEERESRLAKAVGLYALPLLVLLLGLGIAWSRRR